MPVFTGDKVVRGDSRAAGIDRGNRMRKDPLSKFERRALEQDTTAVYIYNISPIFRWQRLMQGIGNFIIPVRKATETVSRALILSKRFVRSYDAGDGRVAHMVEEPEEVAEDLLRCSKQFPEREENNLLSYGCFMTVGKPLEALAAAEREKLMADADAAHRKRCREKVFEADGWADAAVQRNWITEMHRQCALFVLSPEELSARRWVTSRGPASEPKKTKECPECGYDVKLAAFICPNCKAHIDEKLEAAYREQQQQKKR